MRGQREGREELVLGQTPAVGASVLGGTAVKVVAFKAVAVEPAGAEIGDWHRLRRGTGPCCADEKGNRPPVEICVLSSR